MLPKAPRFQSLIEAFLDEGVDFVVIGGFALILHGGRHVTLDSDFAVSTSPSNVKSLVAALGRFHPVPIHLPEGTPFVWDERSIFGPVVSLRTDCGDLDLLFVTPGVDTYEGLRSRAVERVLGGRSFPIASIEDLEAMKREAGRTQDLAHLEELQRIKRLAD